MAERVPNKHPRATRTIHPEEKEYMQIWDLRNQKQQNSGDPTVRRIVLNDSDTFPPLRVDVATPIRPQLFSAGDEIEPPDTKN